MRPATLSIISLALEGMRQAMHFQLKKSLPAYTGFAHYIGHEFDPLAVSEGVEIGIELSGFDVLDVVVT